MKTLQLCFLSFVLLLSQELAFAESSRTEVNVFPIVIIADKQPEYWLAPSAGVEFDVSGDDLILARLGVRSCLAGFLSLGLDGVLGTNDVTHNYLNAQTVYGANGFIGIGDSLRLLWAPMLLYTEHSKWGLSSIDLLLGSGAVELDLLGNVLSFRYQFSDSEYFGWLHMIGLQLRLQFDL